MFLQIGKFLHYGQAAKLLRDKKFNDEFIIFARRRQYINRPTFIEKIEIRGCMLKNVKINNRKSDNLRKG